jgi:predicted  nucleic acid-binding Zn-ribbon protein
MDKASEQRLLQMMERLFAKQSELIREITADMKARTEALRDGLKSYGKETATCQTETTSSSEEMKEMEARADARQDKADAKIEARFNQFNEEIKAHQAKADAQADAHVERMEAIMCSIPSDIDRILQQKIEA